LFLFAVLLSALGAETLFPAISAFTRILLYFLFFYYVAFKFEPVRDFIPTIRILSISVFFTALLALLQWFNQGAIFNNYLVFGEQPYNFSTYGVVRENLLDSTVIPSYGTFRHPNILGGFLAITLLWLLVMVPESKFVTLSFIVGTFALLTTFGYYAFFAFLLGIIFLFLNKKISLIVTLAVAFFSLTLPLFTFSSVSLERRAWLLDRAYTLIYKNPLFGIGLNSFSQFPVETRFNQPVHNVFILILVECGVLAFILFAVFLGSTLTKASKYRLFFTSLLQMVLLFSFDHYFLTIHQTLLLFLLTCGIVYSYNLHNAQ
jgi:hypothetical protein